MLKKRFHHVFVALFLAVATIHCGTTDETPAFKPQPEIAVKDGSLHFASPEAFERTLHLLAAHQNKLDAWEKQWDGFVSMRTAFEAIPEEEMERIGTTYSLEGYEDVMTLIGEGEEMEAAMNIEDPILATLISSKGLLFIDNAAYKFSRQRLIKINNYDAARHGDIESYAYVNGMLRDGVEVYQVEHEYAPVPSVSASRVQDCDWEYKDGRKLKRLKGSLWTTNIGPYYSSAGAKTAHQRRVARIWWADKTPELRLQVQGQVKQHFPGLPNPPITKSVNYDSGISYNDGRDGLTFDFCVSTWCRFTIDFMASTHYALCEDGQARQCTNTW